MRPFFFASLLALPLSFAASAIFAPAAHANNDATTEVQAVDPAVARLLEAKHTLRWNYSAANGRYGHAEALVEAPAEKVAKTASDFGRYKELHRKFATARVVGKDDQGTDVYMRYPVQIGRLTIEFYEIMRFGQPRAVAGAQVIEGRGIKGDMKAGHTVITVKPVGPRHSLLQVDVLLVPKIPAPQSMIDEELRDGAHDFVNALKDRAQGHQGTVTAL